MSPAVRKVLDRLDGARQHWWLFTLLTSAVLVGCLSLTLLLLFTLTDALVRLPQHGLQLLGGLWLLVSLGLVGLLVRRLLGSQRSLEATARRLEVELPELGSDLINLVQLSDGEKRPPDSFAQAAVQQSAARLSAVRFELAAQQESRWRRFCACMQTPRDLAESFLLLGGLLALAALGSWLAPNWGTALSRLLQPWRFVPSVGSVAIVQVTPGNSDVLLGSSVTVEVEIRNPAATPYRATLFLTPVGESTTALPMTAREDNRVYRFTLPTVAKPLDYRLEIGDSQTAVYHLGVRQKPAVAGGRVTYRYPRYLKREAETISLSSLDLEAPQYTVAELQIRPTVPIAEGRLRCGGAEYVGRVEEKGSLLVVEMPMLSSGTFTVHLVDDLGHSDPEPETHRMVVATDQPPRVEVLQPAREETVAPGTTLPVVFQASDDYGLGHVRLETRLQKSSEAPADGPITTVYDWSDVQRKTSALVHHELKLSDTPVEPGQTLLLRAVAWDERSVSEWGQDLKPQQTATAWHAVRVVSKEAKLGAAVEELDQLRQALWKLLEGQLRAQAETAAIRQKAELAEAITAAGAVRSQQIALQKEGIALAQSIVPGEREEPRRVKQALNQLALGPMLEAVRYGDTLVKLTAREGVTRPTAELLAVQDRIIAVLRELLNTIRRAEEELLAEAGKRTASDLPNDVQEKLQQAHDKLAELLKEQKKVIDASHELAKTPVEDFTEQQEQLLKRLAAVEDDFSRFMKDLHSDLSKLPEQDFANPSLLKELVEIQTEIKMAEDALLKKTVDIAVPLEQLGYERAEELKTNIEKWLPDTPDRERWSQEESTSDADKEAPMAELPGELEDLVGELMEEEEALFDEMEDVSSSAADSLDKGAGWDALDGPISNMSARGVTGNRLPNTSEIGGRSGEGRSGKSSGEFVGDEAVGKGGRKTPSRLTPDPYVKGQIKDHSQDPTGGATGGGKESGEGAQGLEGPVPNSPRQREANRLAGRQAELRNKAEGIDLQMQVSNYHHTDLKRMIEVMAQVERDVKAGRYRNALRQREVLAEGLGNVKQYVGGEFRLQQDTTLNLPAEIQKEILGSMHDPSPAGWEELNRRYFERLSTSPPTPPKK